MKTNNAEKIHVDEVMNPMRLVKNGPSDLEIRSAFMQIMSCINPFELAKSTGITEKRAIIIAELYLQLLKERE